MNRKSITDSPEAVKFMQQFKVTNVVAGRGHDCGGLICYLKKGSKTLVDFHDDGWGGEPEIRFENDEAEQLLRDKLTEFNFAQHLFDNGWEFMKSPDRIDFLTQVECLISGLVNLKEKEKTLRRQEKKGIYIQEPDGKRSTIYWKGWNIAKMKQHPSGNATIRQKVLQLQSEGNKILNTNLDDVVAFLK